jgi:hypothetical protein
MRAFFILKPFISWRRTIAVLAEARLRDAYAKSASLAKIM